jgi:hypothetical protein
MYYDDTPKPGGIKGTYWVTAGEFASMLCPNQPEKSKEETLEAYRSIIDNTPDKWLKYHLDWSVKEEEFELAAYIRDVAKSRGVDI